MRNAFRTVFTAGVAQISSRPFVVVSIACLCACLAALSSRAAAESGKKKAGASKEAPYWRLEPYIGKWQGRHDCNDKKWGRHRVTLKRDKKKKRMVAFLKSYVDPKATEVRTAGNSGIFAATVYVYAMDKPGFYRWEYTLPSANPLTKLLGRRKVTGRARVSKDRRAATTKTSMGALDQVYEVRLTTKLSKSGSTVTFKSWENVFGKHYQCWGKTRRISKAKSKKRSAKDSEAEPLAEPRSGR